jgi:hypothetical protein
VAGGIDTDSKTWVREETGVVLALVLAVMAPAVEGWDQCRCGKQSRRHGRRICVCGVCVLVMVGTHVSTIQHVFFIGHGGY